MTGTTIRVVADREIPRLRTCLRGLVELVLLPGGAITAAAVKEADALLVRTLTRVDERLLAGSAVRFVGSATSGRDHIDTHYLESRGIRFAHAAGSNAGAVVDYCFAVLACAAAAGKFDIGQAVFGIVGAGAVGGRFARRLRELHCAVRVCDPPLKESAEQAGGEDLDYCSLEEALACDVVSLHVPLTRSGPYPTGGLLHESTLATMRRNAVLINTSRGEVIAETPLLRRLGSPSPLFCALDVWRGEPRVNPALVAGADLATPHIAGYSRAAKLAATDLIASQLCRFFQLPPPARVAPDTPGIETLELPPGDCSGPALVWNIVAGALPLQALSGEFKSAVAAGTGAAAYGELRRRLRGRTEFRHLAIGRETRSRLTDCQQGTLAALGFNLGNP